ncbi:hypothetical protein ACET3X_006215 [Alternaria dauci]|uniref:Mid2 domain-containing protein n=1 Tax=Alternaria dauci TaxID=48095 RepID=A0ABR3UHN0_9PLEO
MYLPVSTIVTATSLLAVSKLGVSDPATNDLSLLTSSATVVARQDGAKPPPSLVTSIQFVTSIAFITSEPTPEVTVIPPTKPSTTELSSSTASITDSISRPTSTGTSATTSTTTPTQTSDADAKAGPWLSAGKIGGIVVGSVFGLIFLGLIVYTLYAASRGINVCDCFGGCCGKHDDDNDNDEEKSREPLPSRSDDMCPHPGVLETGPGEGYTAYRPAHPSGDHPPVPLPLVLPQQIETQQRHAGRLQKGQRGV